MNAPFQPVAPEDNGQLVQLTLSRQPRCPYCRDDIHLGQALLVCPACQAVIHQECLGKRGRCTTYGCRYGQPLARPLRRPRKKRLIALAAVIALTGGVAFAFSASDTPPIGCPPTIPPSPPAPQPQPHIHWERPIIAVPRALPQPRPQPRPQPQEFTGLTVPAEVFGDEVIIRGTLDGEGPLRVEVRGPTGNIAWDGYEPGPFATAVTLPGRGRHEVVIEVQDAWGRSRTSRYWVWRR